MRAARSTPTGLFSPGSTAPQPLLISGRLPSRQEIDPWVYPGTIARRVFKGMGTALFRRYLALMIPEVRTMRAAIDRNEPGFPDLLSASSRALREIFEESLGHPPEWARELSFRDYFGIRHRKFSEQLAAILAQSEDRVTIDRRAREVIVNLGGDNN